MRTLPLRLTPLPGEAFDGWLHAYAARLRISIADLEPATVARSRALAAKPVELAVNGLNPSEVAAVAAATGVDPKDLAAMWQPLNRYTAMVSERFQGTLRKALLPLPASRFCPHCLDETGGRWMSTWRLPTHVACLDHRCYLLDRCPTCAKEPRRYPRYRIKALREGWVCATEVSEAPGKHRQDCGTDLRAALTTTVPQGTLHAQSRLKNLTSSDACAARVAADRLVELVAVLVSLPESPLVPRTDSFRDAETAESLLDRASQVLDNSDAFNAYALADVRQRPPALPARIRSTTPELVTRLVKLRDPHLRPTERLRWRSLTAPQRPKLDQADIQRRQDAIPSALWVDWTIRLCPPTGLHVDIFRTVAGAALLVPGATAPVETLFADHRDPGLAKTFSHVVQFLPPPPADAAILRVLTQLAENVDRHGTPIDYARRRHLAAAEPLIDATQWDAICEQAGVPTGGRAKLTNAQRWIWETMTGDLLSDAPGDLKLVDHSILGFHLFALHLPTAAAAALDNHAARLLERHSIDEPLTWSPPLDWADSTDTPGVDPDSIDPETIHGMLRAGVPLGKIADQLDTSIAHLRWIVRRHPPQLRSRSQANKVLRGARPADLTPDRLNQLVNIEGRTFRDLARELGMHRRRLAELLRQGGYAVPPSQRRSKYKPKPEWLREQYLDRRRTLPDIAAELGTTAPNVALFAKEYNIPLRPRGGASHASAVNHHPGLPQPLASALAGQGGYQRIQRFQTMANSTSIGEAAKTLEIEPCTISTQLTKLERAVGGVLLRRRQGGGVRLELTPLGRVLLDQADAHLNEQSHAPQSTRQEMIISADQSVPEPATR